MSEYMDAVVERASNPSKGVSKVVSVRLKTEDYEALLEEAAQAGVRPGEMVRAAVETMLQSARS